MEQQISIRGRTARKMIKMANHMPIIGHKAQSGEIRAKLSERERLWECPGHLEVSFIDMNLFGMELLRNRKVDTQDIQNNSEIEETEISLEEAESTGKDNAGIDVYISEGETFNADKVSDNESKLYGDNKGIILQLHGGGYYGRMHNTYRDMAALYNEISNGYDVLSVDYRVAPDNPYPAALEDAVTAYEWILDNGYSSDRIFVAGDSAGGGLTLALCLYLRDHDMQMPAGIVTMSAWTDLTKSGESYHENFNIDPMFGGSTDTLVYKDGYYREDDPENPYISPVNGDYTGFPPMLMQVGEYEMLLSDTLTVAENAKKAGVMVKSHVYPGMFHVFQMGLTRYPEAKEAWVEVGKFIRYIIKSKDTII